MSVSAIVTGETPGETSLGERAEGGGHPGRVASKIDEGPPFADAASICSGYQPQRRSGGSPSSTSIIF